MMHSVLLPVTTIAEVAVRVLGRDLLTVIGTIAHPDAADVSAMIVMATKTKTEMGTGTRDVAVMRDEAEMAEGAAQAPSDRGASRRLHS